MYIAEWLVGVIGCLLAEITLIIVWVIWQEWKKSARERR